MAKVTAYSVANKTGLLSEGEVDLLKRLISYCDKYPTVVIIGSGSGTSTLAVLEQNPNAFIFSIDNEFPTTDRYDPGEKQNLIDAGYWSEGNVIQVLGDSQLIGRHWPIKYDFIFIDGDHRYQFIHDDILLWLPLAKTKAIVAFHDYGDKKVKPKAGVKQAVDELIINNDRVFAREIGYERFTKAFILDYAVSKKDLDVYD